MARDRMTKMLIKMKKNIKIKRMLTIFLVAIVLFQVYKFFKVKLYLNNSDTIVRISFSGLEYILHPQYEYYILGSKSSCRIPNSMVERQFGEREIEQQRRIELQQIAVKGEYEIWSIYFRYDTELSHGSTDEYPIETPYGDHYKLTYRFLKPVYKRTLPLDEQHKIWQITEKLLDGKMSKEKFSNVKDYTIISYEIIHKDDIWYILLSRNNPSDTLVRFTEDGSLVKLLELSDGMMDYFYKYK